MKKKINQDPLMEIQQLKQEIDVLKSLCEQKTTENENLGEKLNTMEWMLKSKQTAFMEFVPEYGDLSDLNEDGLIKKSIPKQQLQDIVSEYLDLLETSAAIYEKNGDYALGIFSSGWCRMMDAASRKLSNTDDNQVALESDKWLCHDSCWKNASLKAMAEGKPVEVACDGGINLYAVPIYANNQIIGSMNFGFGTPPKDEAELKKLSKKYKIPLAELQQQSNDYIDRPEFVIDYAKQRIRKSAKYLGYLVERQMAEKKLLNTQQAVDKSPLSIFWISPEGKFIYANETAAKKLQYSREELLSMHVWDIDPNYPREKRKEMFKQYQESGELSFESAHRMSDGKMLPVKINSYYLAFEDQEMEIAEVEDITERKKHEEQLKLQAEILDQIGDHVSVTDLNGKILYANKAECNSIGLTQEQIIGKSIEIFGEDETQGSTQKEILETTLKAGAWRGEVVNFDKEGNLSRILDCRTTLLMDSNNNPKGLIGVSSDITKRKRAEEELRRTKDTYESIFNSVSDAIYVHDENNNFIDVNHGAVEMYGYSKEELIGKSPADVSAPGLNDHKSIESIIQNVSETGSTQSLEFWGVRKNGEVFPKEVIINKGTYFGKAGIIMTSRDITERKKAENSLKESETKFRALFENANDAIFLVDGDEFIDCNIKTLEMFKCRRDQIIGCKPYDFSPTYQRDGIKSKESALKKISAAIKGKSQSFEWQHMDYEGNLFEAEVSLNHVVIEGKDMIQAIVRDITYRKKAEEALRENERRFRMVLENMPILLNAFDHEGNFIVWNKACEEVTGYKASEVIGNPDALNWMYPDKAYRELVWKSSEDPLNTQNEFNLLTKNGEIRIISWFDTYHYVNIPGWASWGIGIDITGRRQAEDKLKASEKKYQELSTLMRLMADNMPDMLWAKNLNNEYIFANKTMCRNLLNAVDTEEPLGKTDMFFAMRERNAQPENPDWHTFGEICRDSDSITLEEMKPMQFDEFGNVKGKFLYLDVHKAPLYDDQGQLIGVVGSARDVTAAKQAENQLRKLSQAVEQSPASMVITDNEGTIEYVNPMFTEITGYTLEEAVGENPRILKSGEQSAEMYAELWKTISSGKEWKGEFHNKKKNGELFWVSALITSITNEKGEILHYLAVKEDITEQKRTETARIILYNIARSVHTANTTENFLETIRQELNRLFDTTNFFVARYNPEKDTLKQLIFCDEMDSFDEWDAGQSISGQVVKSGKTIFLRGDEIDSFSKQHKLEVMGTDSACWLGVPIVTNNQVSGAMVIQHYTNPEAYSNADVVLFEMVAHETGIYLEKQIMVENLIRAKDQAEESDRLKSAFLANMSHEIRTPMNGILGFAELLKEPQLTDKQQQQYIEIIERSGERMLNIINDIVDISRIESGLIDVALKELNINEQLDYIYAFFKPQIEAKGMQLQLSDLLPAEKAIVVSDREKLLAILTNLVKNAIKYSKNGSIEFGCYIHGSTLKFFVKDSGIGIPKDRQHAIFDRFVQADIEDKEARQGAGLGLAISKAYTELLGGEIWVESEEGKGSTFYFTLPYQTKSKAKENLLQGSLKENKDDISKKLTVLIVEDDEVSGLLLEKSIKIFSKEIFTAGNGVEAVNIAQTNPDIDLILMDIKMPGMDGEEATKQIRKFNKDVVIIAQTAKALTGDKQSMLDAGCNDYITKPINRDQFHALIHKYFGE